MEAMLDVAIGLMFVFVVLSLLCTTIAEGLEQIQKYRAHYLRLGIEKLLLDGNTDLRAKLYSHPIIKSLYTTSAMPGIIRSAGPSYIPSRQFALAFLDVVTGADARTGSPRNGAELQAALTANAAGLPPSIVTVMRTLIGDAGGDLDKLKANVQAWFDGSMDRVAGWYKRRAQMMLLVIAMAVAVGLNADTLEIMQTLSTDSVARASVVAMAETYARQNAEQPRPIVPAQPVAGPNQPPPGQPLAGNEAPAVAGNRPLANVPTNVPVDLKAQASEVVKGLTGLGLPIGWRWHDDTAPEAIDSAAYRIEQRVWPGWPLSGRWREQLATHSLGWLFTGLALSLGAPFWFDLLNKVMVIRSTVKPREKSQEEGSEDRAIAGSQSVRIEVAPVPQK